MAPRIVIVPGSNCYEADTSSIDDHIGRDIVSTAQVTTSYNCCSTTLLQAAVAPTVDPACITSIFKMFPLSI